MKKGGLIYILFILSILLIVLFVILKNENEVEQNIQSVIDQNDIQEEVVEGYEIAKDYEKHKKEIDNGTYEIHLINRKNLEINFKNLEELNELIYVTQQYDKEVKNNNARTIVKYSIHSYANLRRALENTTSFNVEKANAYFGEVVDIVPNGPKKSRPLKEGEVYGGDVVTNYVSHKAQIENRNMYFRVVDGNSSKLYVSQEQLEEDMSNQHIYKKSFELTNAGTLKGYTFTKVE